MNVSLSPHLESLLEAAREGSPDALGVLFESFRPVLRVLARRAKERRRVRSKIADSDLIQDTFATAYKAFEQFRGRSPQELLSWLERILQRLSANSVSHFKLAKRDIRREISLNSSHPRGSALEPEDDRTPSPPDEAIRHETCEAVRHSLLRLPEIYRHVFQLHFAEGKDIKAVAIELNISEGAVRKRLFRALHLCRDSFGWKS